MTTIDELPVRQRQVITLAATGLTRAQIGRRLGIAESTVSNHLEAVYRITHTRNLVEALAALGHAPTRAEDARPWQPLDGGELVAVPAEVLRMYVRIAHLLCERRPQPHAAAALADRALRQTPNTRRRSVAARTAA